MPSIDVDAQRSLVIRRAANLSEDLNHDKEEPRGDHTDILHKVSKIKGGRKVVATNHSKPRRSEMIGIRDIITGIL